MDVAPSSAFSPLGEVEVLKSGLQGSLRPSCGLKVKVALCIPNHAPGYDSSCASRHAFLHLQSQSLEDMCHVLCECLR